MRTEKLTPLEQDAVAAHHSGAKKKFMIILAAQVVVLAGASTVLFRSDIGEWHLFMGAIVLADAAVLMFISKEWTNARRDLRERMKVAGTFRIIGKMSTGSKFSLIMEDEFPRKILVSQEAYERVSKDEQLHFEFSQHSGVLLSLRRGEEVLYTAGSCQAITT